MSLKQSGQSSSSTRKCCFTTLLTVVSVPAALDGLAGSCPLLEPTEERPRIPDPEPSKRERRTGARLFSRSTAVRDNWLVELAQLFRRVTNLVEWDGDSARDVTGGKAVSVPNIDDRDGSRRGECAELFE